MIVIDSMQKSFSLKFILLFQIIIHHSYSFSSFFSFKYVQKCHTTFVFRICYATNKNARMVDFVNFYFEYFLFYHDEW